jgi:hypothetical protein
VLRRWDHTSPTLYAGNRVDAASDGALPLVEGEWIALEDGVEIQFQRPAQSPDPGTYRGGNYWTIPARTVTGDVEWPQGPAGPIFKPSDGVHYHYAALALVKGTTVSAAGWKTFKPIA